MQMLDQPKLEPHRCPHRYREDCLRDVIVGTASEKLHAHGARVHLDHDLTHKLDGSEEHMGNAALHTAGGRTCTGEQHGRSRSLASAWHGGTMAGDAAECAVLQCLPVHSAGLQTCRRGGRGACGGTAAVVLTHGMHDSCAVRKERGRQCWACAAISRRDARAAAT